MAIEHDNAVKASRGTSGRIPTGNMDWQLYDSLPASIRNAYNHAGLPFMPNAEAFRSHRIITSTIERGILGQLKRELAREEKHSAMQVYGPDHPQAHETWKPLQPLNRKARSK